MYYVCSSTKTGIVFYQAESSTTSLESARVYVYTTRRQPQNGVSNVAGGKIKAVRHKVNIGLGN